MDDPYKTLGADRNASDDELKKLYRKLALKYHPDHQNGKSEVEKKEAEERFKKINEAYEILSDKEKKAQYDQFGTVGGNGGMDHMDPFEFFRKMHGGFGFSSGFGPDPDMFGGFGSAHESDPMAPKDGQSLRIRMSISFKEMIFGTKKSFTLDVDDPCPSCHGTGADGGEFDTCPKCNGTGFVQFSRGMMIMRQTCNCCHGSGKIVRNVCKKCGGTGYVKKGHDIDLNIPKMIRSGTQLHLTGAGSKGINGGRDGDLFVVVNVEESKLFRLDTSKVSGIDLITFVYVDPITASLGGKVDVYTPTGKETIDVKPGTQNGDVVRIFGKGYENYVRKTGDLVVEIRMSALDNLDKCQIEVLERLKETIKEKNDPKKAEYEKLFGEFKSS